MSGAACALRDAARAGSYITSCRAAPRVRVGFDIDFEVSEIVHCSLFCSISKYGYARLLTTDYCFYLLTLVYCPLTATAGQSRPSRSAASTSIVAS